jgi:formylglycine-generating enzyme required for sulfatase activity
LPYCKRTTPHGWGRGRIPVVHVSWHDTKVYLEWLIEKTGIEYRLLTEAEWEYCCRGGTETDYWFGNEVDETKANYGGHHLHPLEVEVLYQVNPFGLWDMSGQVWEWVGDPWHPNHYGRPRDGGIWATQGSSELHVVRGGSWKGSKGSVRSASRSYQISEHRVDNIGFRIAKDGE